MTDTFSSGSNAPHGGARPDSQPARDVTSALAELERKLHELEQELTSIGRRRLRPQGPVDEPPAAATTSAESRGRLIDERAEPEPPLEQAAVEWATPAERATPVQEFVPTQERTSPGETSPSGRETSPGGGTSPSGGGTSPGGGTSRDGGRSPSDAELAGLAELRRFRDRVERFATELTDDYDAMLGRVMAGLSGRGSSEPPFDPAGAPSTPRMGPVEQTSPPRAAPGPEETLFEGRVELGVGPFYDIASLGAFEQDVAALPGVSEVAVRRFEASHAVVDLRLATPVALVGELRRALRTGFSIRQVAEGRMLLTFDDA